MGKTCAVITCPNDQSVESISFFKFRKQDAWLEFIRTVNGDYAWEEMNGMHLCSDHFEKKFIVEGANRRDIAKHGYPTLLQRECSLGENMEGEQVYEESTSFNINLDEVTHVDSCHCCVKVKDQDNLITQLTVRLAELTSENDRLQNMLHAIDEKLKTKRNDVRVLTQSKKRKDESKQKAKLTKKARTETEARTEAEAKTSVNPEDKQTQLINELIDRIKSSPNAPFSELMREFCFLLHYYGPRAYEFARSYLNVLPHDKTLAQWVKHINTNPGFLPCSLDFLQKQIAEADKVIHYAVSVDEVYTRKEIVHDGEGFVGFTDYGDILENPEPNKEAKTALFLMATAINADHRVPIGYVMTNGLKADTLAQIITKTLETIHLLNGRVLSVTFDGLGVNLRAMERLGANFDVLNPDFKPYIIHPQTQEKVHIIMDPSHMFKLLRNLWNHYKVMIDKDGNKVKWSFISDLQTLQQKCGMRLANKLSTRHVNFHKQKMKTNLCVQTFSSSVSTALGVCKELGIVGFEDCKPTESFLALIDRLFDSMNSKSKGKGYKSPLKPCNMDIYKKLFSESKEYLTNLKVFVKGELKPILQTGRKTAIVGLLVTIASLEAIMDEMVANQRPDLMYLPTYKLSQDLLEMFFSVLRSRFGYNNNPNSKQLMHALKGILCTNTKCINTGNCLEQEVISTKVCPLGNYNAIVHDECSQFGEEDDDDENELYEEPNIDADTNAVISNVVGYVSGYVVRKICDKLKCPKCVCKLMADTEDVEKIANDCVLILHKDNGGLVYPSYAVVTVSKITEATVREAKRKGLGQMKKTDLMNTVYAKCLDGGLIENLRCGDDSSDSTHAKVLIREISSKYLKARMHYIAKESTLNLRPTTTRSTCVNLTQFGGN